jgi:inactivated superfamily I helicase
MYRRLAMTTIDPFNPPGTEINEAAEEKDLNIGLETFRGVAKQAFTDAYNLVIAGPPDTSHDDETTKQRKLAAWEAGVAKAKGQLASALQQLVQADVMFSEALGRKSYRSLVKLIASTNNTLTTLVNDTSGSVADLHARSELITANAALLQALANIAPLTLWKNSSSGGGGS